jgi:hypothetical protein
MDAGRWDGITMRSGYGAEYLAKRDELADAAHQGDWSTVFGLFEGDLSPNFARVGGSSGYGVLHQAAWHGADLSVVTKLVACGAWRTLRALDGLRPVDVAVRGGHGRLVEILEPVEVNPVPEAVLAGLERQLHVLIMLRVAPLVVSHRLRLPQLGPLTECAEPKLWFPVPELYGGFSIELCGLELSVTSLNRVVGGWGQKHLVAVDGVELVEDGWDG